MTMADSTRKPVVVEGDESFLFTQIGANDPNFNLRNEQGFIRRVKDKQRYQFISVLEPHGEYNPGKEFTVQATSRVSSVEYQEQDQLMMVGITIADLQYLVVINRAQNKTDNSTINFNYQQKTLSMTGRLGIYRIDSH